MRTRKQIPTDLLRSAVIYDAESGEFYWRNRKKKTRVGSHHSGGYIEARIKNYRVYLHRIAWQYVYGEAPPNQVDHINGNRSDNRICNLRLATQHQNSANMRRRSNNKSGMKGVVINPKNGRIYSFIHVNGKTRYLGTFPSVKLAHMAYREAAQYYFLEYARTE